MESKEYSRKMPKVLAWTPAQFCDDFHREKGSFRVLHGLQNRTFGHKSLCVRATTSIRMLNSCFGLYFSLLALVAYCVKGGPRREVREGQGLHYSVAREYMQLPLLSDSPPPLATAAGLDKSR